MDELMKKFENELDEKLIRVVKIQNDVSSLQTELNSIYTDLREFIKAISQQIKENKDRMKIKKSSSDESDIIKFNIGGTVFSTFKATITKKIPKPSLLKESYGSNLLESMMNGEKDVTYDENQTIFIDRSPKYFNYILDYLRTANTTEEFTMPKNKLFLQELIREARFYQVNGLKDSIKDLYNNLVRNGNRQEKHRSEQDSDSDNQSNSLLKNKTLKNVIGQDSFSKDKSYFDSTINLDQSYIENSQKNVKANIVEKQEIIKSVQTYSIEQENVLTTNKIQTSASLNSQHKLEQKVPVVEVNKIASPQQTPNSSIQLSSPVKLSSTSNVQDETINKIPSPVPNVLSNTVELPVKTQVTKQEIPLENINESKRFSESSTSMLSSIHQNGNYDESFGNIKGVQLENPKALNESQHLITKTESSSKVRSSESSSVISQEKTSNASQPLKETYTYFKNCFISYIKSTKEIYISFENFHDQIAKIQPIIDNCLDPYEFKSSKLCIGQYKEDECFYRCRVLEWNNDKSEALCVFIDYGNTEIVRIDTITKMNGQLRRVKPLALYCKLEEEFDVDSTEFKQISDLTISETRFDIKVKTAELESFYAAKNYDYGPIVVELRASVSNVIVNKVTLAQKHLWQQTDMADTNVASDEWENVKEAK